MRLSRRELLSSMAALGVAMALPRLAHAEEDVDSIFDVLARNRVLRDADRSGNTAAAMQAVDTNEPIVSFDTQFNYQSAIAKYEGIVSQGGWEPMPKTALNLVLGNSRNSVIAVKRRLMVSGDMAPQPKVDDLFDQPMDAGVRMFQARHGLLITGKIDEPTLYAMAVPADYRLNQLRLNALRLESLAPTLTSDRYVLVNIPAAIIEAVEGGIVAQRHTAIVGRVERATPIMNSKIHQVKFNPYWTVPKSIIEKDIIKYMNDDPQYLTKYNIRIFDGKGNEIPPEAVNWQSNEAVNYTLRQDPGGENSMGHCKIDFYNPYDCYLHDTPQKALFGENARFHSSGCVRVENVDELVTWLLRDNGGWDMDSVHAAFDTNENINVPLKVQVPIHTTYISAWANKQETVSFRSDVYDFDQAGKVTFEG
jgi:murein L,D-transpeptidase YcbB/YkuD